MKMVRTLAIASALVMGLASGHEAQAYTVIDFGPNGLGGICRCYSLQDGLTVQAGRTPSFLAVSNCQGSNGYSYSVTMPEGSSGGTFPSGNVVSSLPPVPAGKRRVYLCGNPPGSTPMINYGSPNIYASYADVSCPNGTTQQQVPAAQQPSWMPQFQGGSNAYPVCNP